MSFSCFSRKRIQFHCLFTVTRFGQTLNQSVYALDQFCVNRRLWDENPLWSRSFSSLVFTVQVYSSVRIGLFSFEEEKLLCFNICRYFKKTWSYLRTIDFNRGQSTWEKTDGAQGWIHTLHMKELILRKLIKLKLSCP